MLNKIENMSNFQALVLIIVGTPILIFGGVFLVALALTNIVPVFLGGLALAFVVSQYDYWRNPAGTYTGNELVEFGARNSSEFVPGVVIKSESVKSDVSMATNRKYTDDDTSEKSKAQYDSLPEAAMIGNTDDDALDALVESIDRMRRGKSDLRDRVSVARAANKYILQDGEYAF